MIGFTLYMLIVRADKEDFFSSLWVSAYMYCRLYKPFHHLALWYKSLKTLFNLWRIDLILFWTLMSVLYNDVQKGQ